DRWAGEPSGIDAVHFEALLSRARACRLSRRAEAALPMLAQALSLWDGPPTTDEDSTEQLGGAMVRLRELAEVAREDLEEARLESGDPEVAAASLEALVAAAPLRERRSALLMRAQYQCGRQADALRT